VLWIGVPPLTPLWVGGGVMTVFFGERFGLIWNVIGETFSYKLCEGDGYGDASEI